MDALMAAVDAFKKAYYPMDTAEGEIPTASQDVDGGRYPETATGINLS